MADKNIQMTQRNSENTAWDNIFPKTKAANVTTAGGSDVETALAEKASLIGIETLTNKTLTAPKLGNAGYIADVNGNEILKTSTTVASAVNEITVSNAATGAAPSLSATGNDTNINLNLIPKGTGRVQEKGVNLVNVNEFNAYKASVGNNNLYNDIKGTTQTPTLTGGKVTQILHKNTGGTTLRTDTFNYDTANQIIETRTLNTGETITLKYHTDTLVVEVI